MDDRPELDIQFRVVIDDQQPVADVLDHDHPMTSTQFDHPAGNAFGPSPSGFDVASCPHHLRRSVAQQPLDADPGSASAPTQPSRTDHRTETR